MISLQDIRDARETIRNFVKRTSLVHSRFLSEMCGGEVYLKLENLQIMKSFKIRGAFNRILHLSDDEMRRGVVTASTGSHALAVAFGANKMSIPVRIIVPKNTPKVKINNIKKYDVELIIFGDIPDESEQKARTMERGEELTYISPYNDELVIAGQGTIGLEILEDLPSVDTVIVPVGGGGLISGISIAMKSIKPGVEILGVQSEASPVMYESLRAGKIVHTEMKKSIADGLFGGIEKGSPTFEIVQRYVDDLMLVKEDTLRKAVYLLWKEKKWIIEASGAASLALMMEKKDLFTAKTIVAVISGGNIDRDLFRDILASEAN